VNRILRTSIYMAEEAARGTKGAARLLGGDILLCWTIRSLSPWGAYGGFVCYHKVNVLLRVLPTKIDPQQDWEDHLPMDISWSPPKRPVLMKRIQVHSGPTGGKLQILAHQAGLCLMEAVDLPTLEDILSS
jgi:hypothetical protein